jgi:phage terminase large subunit-like protein
VSPSPSPATKTFELSEKQRLANILLAGPATHILLRGGSRSGKTFVLFRAVVARAIKAPESTHVVLRLRFNHLKDSIIGQTMPAVFKACFPDLPYHINKTDWFVDLPNQARILFGGLDDKDRTEKILGQEHSTIYLNECSQISYGARNKAITRLAQNSGLKLKAYYDANPPTVAHWTYRMFEKKLEPISGAALENPDRYATMAINPIDNLKNLPEEYLAELKALPEKERRRFLEGKYLEQVDGALWTFDLIDRNRIAESQLPALRRIVISVDPSGCHGPEDFRSDEIGLVAVGEDGIGNGYVLDDRSGRYSPEGWGAEAVKMLDYWQADRIIGERNFGGAMVESTIRAARPNAPVKLVTASRGKVVRAEPVAALYELNRVKHFGVFPVLEDQLCEFSSAGFQGAKSPDHADALVWGLTELLLEENKTFAFGSV